MTLFEHRIRMKAYQLSDIDRERDMHWQAWLNWQVQATKRSGKKIVPIYKNFKQFFDYEKFIGNKKPDKQSKPNCLMEIIKNQKKRREDNGDK